jgi:GT2 family glycosyltransferase
MVLSNLPKKPFVSIIILNYNASQYLEACISTVMDTNLSSEVIVVDNASKDGSVDLLKTLKDKYGQLKVIFLSKNVGFSVGNNIGSKYAHGKYLLFLNPDTFVDPDWLEGLVMVLDADETIGAAQPKMLMPNKIIDSAGGFMTPLGLAWCRGYNERDNNQYNEITDIFFAKGAALMVRKSIFDRVGKFDPLFFFYYEETDLCWRIS